jgi:hypothetical protein
MSFMAAKQIRCPECGKRLFDLEDLEGSRFKLLIVCRCRLRLSVELPNQGSDTSPLLVRAQ